jgi:hypothetical protein
LEILPRNEFPPNLPKATTSQQTPSGQSISFPVRPALFSPLPPPRTAE